MIWRINAALFLLSPSIESTVPSSGVRTPPYEHVLKILKYDLTCYKDLTVFCCDSVFNSPASDFFPPNLPVIFTRRSCKYREGHRRNPLFPFFPLQQPAFGVFRTWGRAKLWGRGAKSHWKPISLWPLHYDSTHVPYRWHIMWVYSLIHPYLITWVWIKCWSYDLDSRDHLDDINVHELILLSCSGAGETDWFWTPGGFGGEPLLVNSDLTYRLLVLTRYCTLFVDLYI